MDVVVELMKYFDIIKDIIGLIVSLAPVIKYLISKKIPYEGYACLCITNTYSHV